MYGLRVIIMTGKSPPKLKVHVKLYAPVSSNCPVCRPSTPVIPLKSTLKFLGPAWTTTDIVFAPPYETPPGCTNLTFYGSSDGDAELKLKDTRAVTCCPGSGWLGVRVKLPKAGAR